jgi:hypothetical protein
MGWWVVLALSLVEAKFVIVAALVDKYENDRAGALMKIVER